MVLRMLLAAGLLATVLSGCKSGSLAARDASVSLNAGVFSPANSVQTLSFTSGDTSTPRADALNGYLYAKRWLACKTTQPGIFSRQSVCSLNTVGRTYAHENQWTSAHPAGACEQCEVWTVPLARARLTEVSDVSASDKTHAVATYAYDVVPNAFGAGLGDWMSSNPVAWCGPDPRAVGAWNQARAGKASFERTSRSWSVSPPAPSGFAANFGAPAAERQCTSP
jgi:hypothetical protein